MHTDARELENNSSISGDVCIIGAGPAGISMALDLEKKSKRVILLEGGGFEYDARMQALYKPNATTGQKYFSVADSRLHYFGGTTGHWGGYCAKYDEADFNNREWVENSGWPIQLSDLEPYYDKSADLFDLKSKHFDLEHWLRQEPRFEAFSFDNQEVSTKIWQLSPPTRFGVKYKDHIIDSENIHLYTYANATTIKVDDISNQVREVEVKNHEGKIHRVKAKYFILACGAIQNARLLLNSNKERASGLGNENDNVGRYFMEHLEVKVSELWFNEPRPLDLYWSDAQSATKTRAELSISEKLQKQNSLLNGTVYFVPMVFDRRIKEKYERWRSRGKIHDDRTIWQKFDNRLKKMKDRYEFENNKAFALFTRLEQSPKENSRIVLDHSEDALGMHRINLNWEVSSQEKRSCVEINKIVGRQFGVQSLGRLRFEEKVLDIESDHWSNFTNGGWHQMGTTRMHDDPKKGVVDANCKIHSVDNLFVAGSSCFTTSGAANPTMTLVALSLRLSDHIAKLLT